MTRVMTDMASNLTKDWIQYLKNNQIAAIQSDPKSGKLNYRRKVTASDVVNFLQVKTDYNDGAINKAIDSVVGSRTSGDAGGNLTTNEPQMSPGTAQPQEPHKPPLAPPSAPSKYASTNQDATDVEPRYGPRPALSGGRKGLPAPAPAPEEPEAPAKRTGGKVKGQVSQTPNAIRKRQARANRKAALNEDFADDPGEDLSEKEVESIFKILANTEKNKQTPDQTGKNVKNVGTEKVRKEEIEKLKSVISDHMSAEQRKQLWDALQESINEAHVDKGDVRQIFNYLGNNKSHRNQNLDIGSLQKAWASAGYPDDTTDIAEILKKHGFDDSAIHSAFSGVLGNGYNDEDSSPEESGAATSGAVLKIAEYIKRAGISKEIIAYMQENYGNELTAEPKQGMFKRAMNYGKNLFKRKATSEDVRQIFTNILKEERRGLSGLIKQEEYTQLGRNKK